MARVPLKGPVVTPEGPTPSPEKLPNGQFVDHWVLSEAERRQGWARPLRTQYVHERCGSTTLMPLAIAETFARDPKFYTRTFCSDCHTYSPVEQFFWEGTEERVGS